MDDFDEHMEKETLLENVTVFQSPIYMCGGAASKERVAQFRALGNFITVAFECFVVSSWCRHIKRKMSCWDPAFVKFQLETSIQPVLIDFFQYLTMLATNFNKARILYML